MERNALIAVVISLIILLAYQELVLKRFYPPHHPEPISSESAPPPVPAAENPPPQAEAAAPVLEAAEANVPERLLTIDTPLYTAVVTSKGARLKSFQLKRYRTTVDPNSPPQETIAAGEAGELPIGVELRGAQGVTPLSDNNAAFDLEGDNLSLGESDQGSVSFAWTSESGLVVRKRFSFFGDRYEVGGVVSVTQVPPQYNEVALTWTKAIDTPPQPNAEVVFDRAAHLDGRKLVEETFDKLDAGQTLTGDIRWAGYAGRHFFAAFAPNEPRNPRLWLKRRDHTVEQKLLIPLTAGGAELPIDIYIGPKDVDSLDRVGHDFVESVNLGWFGFIAKPLLHGLTLSHRITGNYGIDIILLTLIIKILFIPLTQTSMKSMRAMQKLQPQMTKIREKFKDTPEQMNKEIMELYRRHKVNPFGGCLPMVLQIPVFIGLYSALMNTVELRHAPFFLWINDLAAPDRLGSLQLPFVQHAGIPVLTLFMGASMFLQQWMTPAAGDPTQRQMMMIMPLMMTFMFVNFPSGLSLYWLVNNVLTIAQQYYMNRTAT